MTGSVVQSLVESQCHRRTGLSKQEDSSLSMCRHENPVMSTVCGVWSWHLKRVYGARSEH